MSIHVEHPFEPPPEERDPVRQLRGRLVAPVTILTAGAGAERAGLTVSSTLVVEGDAARFLCLVGDLVDLWTSVAESRKFIVHVLPDGSQSLARRFAGLEPAPGGPFTGHEVEDTLWGPHLLEVENWAGCSLEETITVGDQMLLVGTIETVSITDFDNPLAYFRGRFRTLS